MVVVFQIWTIFSSWSYYDLHLVTTIQAAESVKLVNLPINPDSIKERDWVLVEYEKERFFSKVICVKGNEVQVRYLQKPYGIREPKEFKCEEDSIFCKRVFNANEHPNMIKKEKKWLWTYLKEPYSIAVHWNKENTKKFKVMYFLSFRDMSFREDDFISLWGHSSLCMHYLYN